MNCPHCRAQNRDGRMFCGRCAAPVAQRCARCGFVNELDCMFCGGCAAPVEGCHTQMPNRSASDRALTLAAEEMSELLRTPKAPAEASIPRIVTQEEIDRLFGKRP